jgi:hypothetical protein
MAMGKTAQAERFKQFLSIKEVFIQPTTSDFFS